MRTDALIEALHVAWLAALREELVTSDNVAEAPSELLRAVMAAAESSQADSIDLGKQAFWRWRLNQAEAPEQIH